VTLDVSININSLRVIQDELSETIGHSAVDFEAYIANQNDPGHIKSCLEAMVQVGGTFRLLEYPGVALLADEMAALVAVMADPEQKITDAMVNALTHCYFVLPRYIEYITIRQRELPILIMPYVNELRVARKAELIPEHYFYQTKIPTLGLMSMSGGSGDMAMLLSSAARLRHMYQAGLVGVIKDPTSKLHFQLLSRAIARFTDLLGAHPHAEIWQLATLVLKAFAAGKLEVTLNRKRNLADIEKLMRLFVNQGEEALSTISSSKLKTDLLFMLMLTSYSSAEIVSLRESYSLPVLDVTDTDIAKQRESMHGPSLETIELVIKALTEELRNAKDILEIGSQNEGVDSEDLALLIGVLNRVADTLSILNLKGPRATLLEQLELIKTWMDNPSDVTKGQFIEAADTLLYLESALAGLDRRELTVDDLNKATSLTRKKIIAGSQLAQAEQLVIQEAQSGIALAKRAITAYVDSNFDSAHIANVCVTLNTVRGGLHMLNYRRAAEVLRSCAAFVTAHINQRNPGDQRHQLLETLADALISLEYYLNELENSRTVNENILEVAEESLAALGYAVQPVNKR